MSNVYDCFALNVVTGPISSETQLLLGVCDLHLTGKMETKLKK